MNKNQMKQTIFNNTVTTDNIYAIVGRWDLQYKFENFEVDVIEKLPKNLAFISICDPSSKPIKTNNHFTSELFISFYDVEEEWSSKIIPLDIYQGKEIYDFIMENKDKQFLINCEAGISRSAGVGLAIEYLFRDKYMYPKWEHFPSKVLQHSRYMPNMTVFNRITMWEQ